MNVIGQIGPLLGTSIFPKEDGPWYVRGMTVCAGFMALVGVLAVLLRVVLARENRRSKDMGISEYAGIPLEEGGIAQGERKVFRYML